MLDEIPLFLAILGCSVGSCDSLYVREVKALSPFSWDELPVLVLRTVKLLVLEPWVPYPHHVVQYHAGDDDELDGGGVMLHGSEQNLEAVCEDAELVVGIYKRQEHDGVEPLVIIIHGATFWRTLTCRQHASHQVPLGYGGDPLGHELVRNGLPFCRSAWAGHHLVKVLVYDCLAHFSHHE